MSTVGIKDIAALAGVSIATVSRTLRDPDRVSEKTRSRVLDAVKESGYTPNNLGVSLRTSRSGNIVVIIPDVSDSFNSGMIKAIEALAQQRGYSILLGDTQGSETLERSYASMVRSRQADGIIMFSHRLPFDVDESKEVYPQIPPLVNSCEEMNIEGLPFVSIDNVTAAYDATKHLIKYGHKDITVITGSMTSPSSKQRVEGYKQAMQEAGLTFNENSVHYAAYTVEEGERVTTEILKQNTPPSAFFCLSDEMAIGCCAAIRSVGLSIPKDISVMGFDNIPFSKYLSPPLTTISQPTKDIGETCIRLLLDIIEGKTPDKTQYILPHELIIRESTRNIN